MGRTKLGVGRKWRLTFEGEGLPMRIVAVSKDDARSLNDALVLIKAALRNAMELGGCRSVAFGVHVEGPACCHEVGPSRKLGE